MIVKLFGKRRNEYNCQETIHFLPLLSVMLKVFTFAGQHSLWQCRIENQILHLEMQITIHLKSIPVTWVSLSLGSSASKLQSFFKPSSGAYLFLLLYTSKEMLGLLWPSMHATTTEATSTQETLPLPRSPEYNEREQATQRKVHLQFNSIVQSQGQHPNSKLMCSNDITTILDTTNLRVFNSWQGEWGGGKEEPLIEPCIVPFRKIREGRKEEFMVERTIGVFRNKQQLKEKRRKIRSSA